MLTGLLTAVLLVAFCLPAVAGAEGDYAARIALAAEYEALGLYENALGEYRAAARLPGASAGFAQEQIVRLEYMSLRRRLNIDAGLQPEEFFADPSAYRGRFFEWVGTVAAFREQGTICSIFVSGSAAEFRIDPQTAYLQPGRSLLFLARLPFGGDCQRPEILSAVPAHLLQPLNPGTTSSASSAPAIHEEFEPLPTVRAVARPVAAPTEEKAAGRAESTPSSQLISAYARVARIFNRSLDMKAASDIVGHVLRYSRLHDVDPRLIMAVIAAESGFRPRVTSPAGAAGLGQLMPATAAGLGISDRYNPEQNIMGAVRVLKGHLDRWSAEDKDRQHALALASYNAGPGAVQRYGGVPPFRETRNYISRVMAIYSAFCGVR